jgi:hypothetical protein
VRIGEVPLRAGPGVVSGVPLFIGFTRAGPPGPGNGEGAATVLRVDGWPQFEASIAAPDPEGFLGYAVRGFFQNGGQRCVVLAVPTSESAPAATRTRALRALFRKEAHGRADDGVRGVLDDIDDVDLVCVPDIMTGGIREDAETVFALQQEVLEYCEDMGERFAILDALPRGSGSRAVATQHALRQWQTLTAGAGALYMPWVRVRALDGAGEAWVPPCGHVAGIYARSDAGVGIHKAPANEIVEGILDVQDDVPDEAQAVLNDAGVNCLRSFARRGIRVWGARTLSGHRQWRYVNVRRIFLALIRWIKHNMNDLAFEPNTPLLWDRVLDRLRGVCYELFVHGALKGTTPEEGFFLKCDAEVNPLEVREEGRVVCEIGLAPGAPSEFIVIRLTRDVAGTFTAAPLRS